MTSAERLFLSEAERTEMVRSPEKLIARTEHAFSGLLQKLSKLEAERAAEKVDHEQVQQQLEGSFAALREEQRRYAPQLAQAKAERTTAVDARNTAQAEVTRLTAELRTSELEVARVKEAEREAQEARRRLTDIGERRVCPNLGHMGSGWMSGWVDAWVGGKGGEGAVLLSVV